MLKVSSNNITFNRNETIKSLTLQNLFPQNIIFKIKVNSVGFLNIEPNKGFIRANSSVPFIIKSLSKDIFEVKVLFTYGFISNNITEFNEEWEKIKQLSKFQHSIILVKRIQTYQSNQKIQPSEQKRKIDSILQQPLERKKSQKHSTRKNSPQKRQTSRSPSKNVKERPLSYYQKINRNKNQNFEQFSKQIFLQQQPDEDSPFYSAEEMQQLIEELHNSEKMHENEKIKNIKLSQQLSISEAKLKEITEDKMHIQTHKSIGIVCEDYHTTFTHLVILGLACFVFGFFLGKIEAEIV